MEPEPSHQKLVVAYCFDDHYAKHAKVAISSLARNSKSPLKVYLVTANLGVETRGDLEKLFEKFDLDCEILELKPNRLEGFRARAHISAMAYSKLALPELIDEERLIYLDVDTLVRGNLEDLFRTDLAGFAVGGVVDPIGANSTKMPISKKSHYINTGVLLMDLAALRASEFTARCMKVYRDWGDKATWLDQCVLNKCLDGQVMLLDPSWNSQVFSDKITKPEWDALTRESERSILHFLGDAKPWSAWCSPLISALWRLTSVQAGLGEPEIAPMTTLAQLIRLADSYHRAEQYQQASQVKSEVIRHLRSPQNSRA